MTYLEIRQAIVNRMVQFTGLAQERIAYPNMLGTFIPPESGLWCLFDIQYENSEMAGIGNKPYTRKPGQIAIKCFAKNGLGTEGLTTLIDALEEHFSYWSQGMLECLDASQIRMEDDLIENDPIKEGFYQMNIVIRFRAG